MAVLTSEIVVHKLSGFVKEHKAIVGEVTREHVVMQLPGTGLLSYFGSSPNRQGLEIELHLEQASRSGGTVKMRIDFQMRPFGWFQHQTAFADRSKAMIEELRRYFVAE